jgi:hypothetical protein
MYEKGDGVKQDYDKAVDYYRLSAEQENPDGLFGLGDCYYFGYGLEKDDQKAAEYYRRALAAGYTPEEEDQARLKELLGDEYQQK